MYVFGSIFDVFVFTSQYQVPDEQMMSSSFDYHSSRFNVQNVFVFEKKNKGAIRTRTKMPGSYE